jgi:hypothetical protein
MATIQQAVQNATIFAHETLGPERTAGIQLEEVESSKLNGEDVWLITLSMFPSALGLVGSILDAKRNYKIFTVLKKSGEVVSMRIRELAGV